MVALTEGVKPASQLAESHSLVGIGKGGRHNCENCWRNNHGPDRLVISEQGLKFE